MSKKRVKITENQLMKLGFNLIDEYDHDHFHTNKYAKGVLFVEFTYEGKELLSCDLTISEVNCMPIELDQIKKLTTILGDLEE